jgi:hypothetical protein
MKFILFTILILGFSLQAAAQPVLFRAKTHDNTLVNVPGTHISLIPPNNFHVSNAFTGLKNGASLIEVYDLPGGAYRTISEDFTKERLEQQGVIVLSEEVVEIDNYNGKLIAMQSDEHHNGLTLVFGDNSFSVIIVSNYSPEDPSIGEGIRQALLGIRYDESPIRDPLSNAVFKMNEKRSAFRYEKRSADTFYYAPASAKADDNVSYFTVTQLAWDYTTSPATIGELMLNEMKKYGLADADIKKKSVRSINGYQGYESEIYATRQGEKCLVYQMVVVHDAKALVVHGIGSADHKKHRDEFRKLAHSIEFK